MEPPGAGDSDGINALCTQISSSFASAGAPAPGPPPVPAGKPSPPPRADALQRPSRVPLLPLRVASETPEISESHGLRTVGQLTAVGSSKDARPSETHGIDFKP